MIVMGLDQAPRHSGFCHGESTAGLVPTWGVKHFESYHDNEIPLVRDYRRWLITLCEVVQPKVIYCEQIVIDMRHINLPVTYQQFAVVGAIVGACEFLGIDLFQVDISTWRKRALGKANKPKWVANGEDGWLKEAAKAACLQRNWLIDDHNAAEAALIWDYGAAHVDPNYRAATKPHIERVSLEREDKDRAFNGK
jgi:hypothetical protein